MEIWRQCDPKWLDQVPAKLGVKLNTLRPEILPALQCAMYVYAFYGKKITVTSTNDSKHQEGSLHYKDLAFDLRVLNIPEASVRNKIVAKMKQFLGADYDVILEKDHIHCEISKSYEHRLNL